jgi:hypothetical protein
VLFDLEPDVIDIFRASPLGELFCPGNLVNQTRARETTGPRATTQGLDTNYADSFCGVEAFVVNSDTKFRWCGETGVDFAEVLFSGGVFAGAIRPGTFCWRACCCYSETSSYSGLSPRVHCLGFFRTGS